MDTSKQLAWIAAATVVGCALGAVWAWVATGGYEAGNSMIGTAALCGMAAAVIVAVVVTRAGRR